MSREGPPYAEFLTGLCFVRTQIPHELLHLLQHERLVLQLVLLPLLLLLPLECLLLDI